MVAVLFAVTQALLSIAALALLVPVSVLLVQVLAAWPVMTRTKRVESSTLESVVRPRFAVLMPAHNESGGIAFSIHKVRSQLEAGDRLLVVADNCGDDTTIVARAAGAEVIERRDPTRRGKGYALDFGVRHLATNAPEIVVIVDADCEVHPGALDAMVRTCSARRKPVQALYLMRSPPDAPLKTRIAEFAWVVKNHARPLGNQRLGVSCQLMGSGMAFMWEQIAKAPLASGHIVEDLQLGLDLGAAGHPPTFCEDALVTSVFPATSEGLTAQRTRWEHGYIDVLLRQGVGLLGRALRGLRVAPIFSALDLCVPPLASLVLAMLAVLVAAGAFFAVSGQAWPLLLVGVCFAMFGVAVALGWSRFGRRIVTGRELMGVPLYVIGKLPMYLRALRRRQVEWVRTRRDDGHV